MKTIKTLTATFLIIFAYTAMASDSMAGNPDTDVRTIAAPAFEWGNPEDADSETAELLKYSGISAPAEAWGSPEDLNEADLEALKVREQVSLQYPALNWGSPEDLEMTGLQNLKTAAHLIGYPEMVIGDPQEIDASDLK